MQVRGNKQYEPSRRCEDLREPSSLIPLKTYNNKHLSNHLGNVLVTIQDRKEAIIIGGGPVGSFADLYHPYIVTATDYYAFGGSMEGREIKIRDYFFGFEGIKKTNEISGEGNHYQFKFREYDPRLGHFWSVDPLAASYPWNSPYAFAENRVIDGIDFEGLEFTQYLQKDKLENRINQLILNPHLINQIGGTCVIASVTYLWILKNSESFKAAVMDLYEKGEAKVGNYKIDPDDHLEKVQVNNNPKVYKGSGELYQADWLILSALQDNVNCCIDFDGTDKDGWGAGNLMSVASSLLVDLGIYNKASVQTMLFLNVEQKMAIFDKLSATGDVILSIDASLLQSNNSGRHAVTYIQGSHSTYQKDGKTYHKFKVQSWGEEKGWDVDVSEDDLSSKVYNQFVYATNE